MQWGYVEGHSGHPWNELVDAGSKWCRLNGPDAAPDTAGISAWGGPEVPDAEWAWITMLSGEAKRRYPPLVDDVLQCTPAQHKDAEVPDLAVQTKRLIV